MHRSTRFASWLREARTGSSPSHSLRLRFSSLKHPLPTQTRRPIIPKVRHRNIHIRRSALTVCRLPCFMKLRYRETASRTRGGTPKHPTRRPKSQMSPLLPSPFPSQYLFTIGHVMSLAFDDGSPIFKQRSSMRRSTGHALAMGPATRLSRGIVGSSNLVHGPQQQHGRRICWL